MSAAIGKAALVLSVNQQGLRSGLATSTGEVNKWADGVGRGLQSKLGNAGRSAGGGVLAGLAGGAARLGGPVLAAAAGVMGLNQAVETLYETSRAGAAAGAFGLSVERFSGIAGVAKSVGEAQREFIESLVTLGKVSAEGAAGTGMVAPQWFADLNLNAKEFNALPIDEKFFGVWEALSKIEDPAKRVRALMVAFGEDGGKYLLPLLDKTPGEVRAMAGSFAISSAEVQKATVANAALTRAQTTLSAAWRTAVIALSPLFERVANGIVALQPLFDWIGRALSTYGTLWGAVWTEAGNLISWVVEKGGEFLAWLGITGARIPTVEQVIVGMFRMSGTAAALTWDTIRSGAGVIAIVAGAIVEHTGGIVGAFRALVDLVANLPDQMKPEGFERFQAGVAEADAKVRGFGRGVREWGQGAVTSWGQSATQFNTWLDRVTAKQDQAAARTARNATAAAGTVAAAAMKLDNAALLKGSSAEVSARIKHEFGGSSTEAATLEAIRQGNGILGGIKTAIENQPGGAGLLPV